MSSLTVLDFAGKNIRFENRGDRVWVSLSDMATATGKRVSNWTRLETTVEFLAEVESITQIRVIDSKVGGQGIPENERGTWAIEEVAIDFAAWCNVKFRVWVSQQIRTLMTEGTVSIAPTDHQLPATYLEALKALVESEEEKERLRVQNELQAAQIDDLEEDVDKYSSLADESFTHSSIVRIAKFNGINETAFKWRVLKAATKVAKLEIKRAPCPRFGEKLLYPHQAWAIAYPKAKLPENPDSAIVLKD
jgi:hypothetical protein